MVGLFKSWSSFGPQIRRYRLHIDPRNTTWWWYRSNLSDEISCQEWFLDTLVKYSIMKSYDYCKKFVQHIIKHRKKLRGKSAFLTDRRKLGGLSFCHLLLVWRNHIWRRHTNGMPLMCDLHTTHHVDDIFISTSSCIAWWRTLKRHARTTHLPFMPIN